MNSQHERPSEEEVADHLWRAIAMLQAMTDRLLTQHGRTAWEFDGPPAPNTGGVR